jgi:hypothetical protein
MTLKEFRKQTKDLPDDLEIVIQGAEEGAYGSYIMVKPQIVSLFNDDENGTWDEPDDRKRYIMNCLGLRAV